MRDIKKYTGRLEIIRSLPLSRNGNPRYDFVITEQRYPEGVFRFIRAFTGRDHAVAYDLPNHDGKIVTVTIGTHYGKPTLNTIEKGKPA